MVPLAAALAIAASPIRVERDLHYAPGPEQVLDAYVAPDARRAVVLIHGGGFHSGSKESLDPTALRFAQSGWTAFSISYRLVPPAPWNAAKEDALAAVRWVRAHSAEFGFDPARLAVFGTSAGGNLAALAATVGRGRSLVAAAASWFGPRDLGSFARTNGVIRRYVGCSCAGRARALSPVSFVGAGDAPLLLANSTNELLRLGQATEMAQRLRAAGIPHRLIVYRGTRHAVAYERDAWAADAAVPRRVDAVRRPAGGLPRAQRRPSRWRDLARPDPGRQTVEHDLRPARLLVVAALPGRVPAARDARLAVVVREEPEPRGGRRHADRAAPDAAVRGGRPGRRPERPLRRRVGGPWEEYSYAV